MPIVNAIAPLRSYTITHLSKPRSYNCLAYPLLINRHLAPEDFLSTACPTTCFRFHSLLGFRRLFRRQRRIKTDIQITYLLP
jgi:hypothetical protein